MWDIIQLIATGVLAFGGGWLGATVDAGIRRRERHENELRRWRTDMADYLSEFVEVADMVGPVTFRYETPEKLRPNVAASADQRWAPTRKMLRRLTAAHPDRAVVRATNNAIQRMTDLLRAATFYAFASADDALTTQEYLGLLLNALSDEEARERAQRVLGRRDTIDYDDDSTWRELSDKYDLAIGAVERLREALHGLTEAQPVKVERRGRGLGAAVRVWSARHREARSNDGK